MFMSVVYSDEPLVFQSFDSSLECQSLKWTLMTTGSVMGLFFKIYLIKLQRTK